MANEQKEALRLLMEALTRATETGLFDAMLGYFNPDIINRFCDEVVLFEKQVERLSDVEAMKL